MQTWFITGTSSGIGRMLTEALLQRGDRVAATLRAPEKLDDLKRTFPDRLWVSELDVRSTSSVRYTVDRAFSELGQIDVLVNNAGFGSFGAAEELGDDDIERLVATNLLGSMHVIRAALPHLRAQGGGRIVQISSEGGQTTYPGFAAYHASKWGIEGFVEAVASEVATFGITCSIVEFGPTATEFGASLVQAEPLPAYNESPIGELRRGFAAGTSFMVREDPREVVKEILAGVEGDTLRLVIGAYAFERIRATLEQRLADVKSSNRVTEARL